MTKTKQKRIVLKTMAASMTAIFSRLQFHASEYLACLFFYRIQHGRYPQTEYCGGHGGVGQFHGIKTFHQFPASFYPLFVGGGAPCLWIKRLIMEMQTNVS